ncbi:MAG: AAA family ATPase [Firmicutes bacterium]|nr:AAA family ATPase [Bacillota bacterium]
MKIAISGKGGVGKTTLAATLALLFQQDGSQVIAVDADPDANLASALGIPAEKAAAIVPLAQMKDLIRERTGAEPGSYGAYFRLNPRVSDIPERFCTEHRGVKLLVMGGVKPGGSGCVCPENVLLKNLVNHLLLRPDEVVILDMEAGIEHLSRGTAGSVDAFIVVVEPGSRSFQTALLTRKMAGDLGVGQVLAVGNKITGPADEEFIAAHLGQEIPVIGYIRMDPAVAEADRQGLSLLDVGAAAVEDIRAIYGRLRAMIQLRPAAGAGSAARPGAGAGAGART